MRRLILVLLLLPLLSATALRAQSADEAKFQQVLQTAMETIAGAENDVVELYLAHQLGFAQPAEQAFIAGVNAQRTDQQTTASSSAPASVSNLEKPGIADLLALAIERGKVSEKKSATSATLSTTPYAIQTFLGLLDTPQNWEEYRWARKISFTGTFSSPDVGTTADFSTFTSGEAKYVFAGNRSPRDAVFNEKIKPLLDPALAKPLRDKLRECGDFESTPFGTQFRRSVIAAFTNWVNGDPNANPPVPGHRNATAAEVQQELASIVPKSVTLDAETEQALRRCVLKIGNLATAMTIDAQNLKTLIDAYMAEAKPFEGSFAILYTRDATVSDYGSVKLLLARDNSPGMSFNLNAQVDINRNRHTRTPATSSAGSLRPLADATPTTTKLDAIRSYAIETGVTFGRFSGGRGDSTFSIKWNLPTGDGAKSGVTGQGQLNVHFSDMMTIPIALAYNSRSTATTKKGLQLNFGISSLLDAFLSNSAQR